VSDLEATPVAPDAVKNSALIRPSVKPATPDLILFDDAAIPLEFITDLLFEQIGGKEILNIARNDIINGQKISYNLIANSSKIAQEYNPKNIFRVPGTSAEFFENFSIKFGLYALDNENPVSLSETGDLQVLLSGSAFRKNDQVEIEVLVAGTLENDTIY
jgi:hypothetical protein